MTLEGGKSTTFNVGSITESGENVVRIRHAVSEAGQVLTGNAAGLNSVPVVTLTGNDVGSQIGYVKTKGETGIVTDIMTPANGIFHQFTNGAHVQSADSLAGLNAVTSGDVVIVNGNGTAGGTLTINDDTTLTIQSNSDTQRTIDLAGQRMISAGSKTNLNLGNLHVTGGKVSSTDSEVGGGAIYTGGTITISGTNTFENNLVTTADGRAMGGAIFAQDAITFSGNGSSATFINNKMNMAIDMPFNINFDIVAFGSVTIKDSGTYYFGGGIATNTLEITQGAEVTLGPKSFTVVPLGSTLKVTENAALIIQGGAMVSSKSTLIGTDGDGSDTSKIVFTAQPTTMGLGTLQPIEGEETTWTNYGTGNINVDLKGFSVMPETSYDIITLTGSSAVGLDELVSNSVLFSLTSNSTDTTSKITATLVDPSESYAGQMPVADLVGLDADFTVRGYRFEITGMDLGTVAAALEMTTGLDTEVLDDGIYVDLGTALTLAEGQQFIWDFSTLGGEEFKNITVTRITANHGTPMPTQGVPEPTTWMMLALGLSGLAFLRRRSQPTK